MASVLKAIAYSESAQKLIGTFNIDQFFDHKIWDTEDLEELRKEIRDFYRIEQKAICSYCRQVISIVYPTNAHIEHIAPKSIHPEYIFEAKNLCVICSDCNQIKRDQETLGEIPETMTNASNRRRYPSSSNAFKIVHPHFDNYDDHILIINGCYIDKGSKKGNFTIGACNLNRKLAVFGWEPNIIDDEKITNEMNSFIDETDPEKRKKHLGNIKKQLFE